MELPAWMFCLTPPTREMVLRMPPDVQEHPMLRVVLHEHAWDVISDRLMAQIVGEVRSAARYYATR